MMRYTDEELDYWGEIFVAGRIREKVHGRTVLTFEQFLLCPGVYLEIAAANDALGRPLRDVSALREQPQFAVEREIDHLPRHDGAPVEKLTHTRWPRNGQSDFTRKVGGDAS